MLCFGSVVTAKKMNDRLLLLDVVGAKCKTMSTGQPVRLYKMTALCSLLITDSIHAPSRHAKAVLMREREKERESQRERNREKERESKRERERKRERKKERKRKRKRGRVRESKRERLIN